MTGWIYFIRCPSNGLIKIGWTEKPPAGRFVSLRSMSPVPLEPLALVRGLPMLETRLHARFRDDWSHGEWFRPSELLMAFVADEAEPWTVPVGKQRRRIVAAGPALEVEMLLAEDQEKLEPKALGKWARRTMLTVNGWKRSFQEWSELRGVRLAALMMIHGGLMPDVDAILVGDEPHGPLFP